MKAIGRFHGLSYAAKKKDMNAFLQVVNLLQFKWDRDFMVKWKDMFYLNGKRGVMPLIEANQSVDLFRAFLKNYEDPVKFIETLCAPEEPDAVICHGDFNRNNLLYRYDKNGHPESVKLFDFQTPMYALPATDIAFFLYLNTTQELREKHWDDLLRLYYDGVKSVVPDMEIPKLNFKKCAAYPYIICSFFLPFLVSDEEIDLIELVELNPHDQAVRYSEIGGEKGTQVLVDIVKHLIEKDYIQESYF